MRSRVQMLRSRVHRMALWGPRLASKISAEPVPWPPELRSHPGRKMLIFHCVFPRLSSRPTVSPRRDDSRCHQVPIFPDQNDFRHFGVRSPTPFTKTVRTPLCKLCLGNKRKAPYDSSGNPKQIFLEIIERKLLAAGVALQKAAACHASMFLHSYMPKGLRAKFLSHVASKT